MSGQLESRPPLRRIGGVGVVALAVVTDLVPWDGATALRGGDGMAAGADVPLLLIPIATVLCYATLLLRWRHPVAVFALIWTFTLSSLGVPQFQPFAGLLVALYAVASRLPLRPAGLALGSLVVPFAIYSWTSAALRSPAAPRVEPVAVALLLLLWLLLASAVWGVGRIGHGAARRAWRLHELRASEAAEAVSAERMRLGRELHDLVSHAVVTMIVQASAAKAVLADGDERVTSALGVIEDAGAQAMSELHGLLRLIDSVDPDAEAVAEAQPALTDIVHLVGLARQAGQPVELAEAGAPGALDPGVANAAYRIVQESLTNSLKYAGAGAPVDVALTWSDRSLQVRIANRAGSTAGHDVAGLSSGHGLAGLRERVNLIGGSLDAGPTAAGFSVRAELPVAGDHSPFVVPGRQRTGLPVP